MKTYVAYYRVSTSKQGINGLGIDAQKDLVSRFIKCAPEASFIEVESGSKDNRPELLKAIEHAKKNKSILVVAKLDRLSRSLTFISSIMDAGIKFVCADMPEANEFTLHIFAALAQQERKMISERTKQALSALKERGVKLGKPENLTKDSRLKGIASNKRKASLNENNVRAYSIANEKRTNGDTLNSIAEYLNINKFRTANNFQFTPTAVKRLLSR